MSSMENRCQLGENAVTVVLAALSSLESPNEEDTYDVDDEELLDSLFRCLFLLLEHSENKVIFAEAGGVQLMIKIMQHEELGHSYYGSAIVALDMAVKDCQPAFKNFVTDASGLDTAFPASMDVILQSILHEKEVIEEHQISLIASLADGVAKMIKDMLLTKFAENDFKRITWLMELFVRYSDKVEAMTKHLKDKQQLHPSELYEEKLQCGFSTLQSIAVILAYLWSFGNRAINARIEKELSQHQLEKKHLRDTLSTYRDNIGNAGESVESAKTAVIEKYICPLRKILCRVWSWMNREILTRVGSWM
ncbi:uncharacterized protein LOC113275712 isoform X1 [Papaver somniferum]|uniref:uncharacterized protein LOC113275712 isoform X1 n=1 Tax=Papaver somniferum TaxID=3469 RepID=UPI000E6FAB86|nr:uncharacterized protein LOC113275712 isoform X1 [Papaver somniferum]